jgi:hypothetical protein
MAGNVVCVSLSHNSTNVLSFYAFTAESDHTYSQILEGLYLASSKDSLRTRFKSPIAMSDKTLIKCYVAQSAERNNAVEVNLGIKCADGCRLFGSFVHFELTDQKDIDVAPKRNAFEVLMSSSKTVELVDPLKYGVNPDQVHGGITSLEMILLT